MMIASLLMGNLSLWHDLLDRKNGHLNSIIEIPDEELSKEEPNLEDDTPMVPINKLGQYFKSDDSNAIIPISYHHRKVEVILASGARVSIMTKQCWEKWGSLPMEKTSLIVKLVDGTTTSLVGMVKDLKIKTFGSTYHNM